MDAAGHTDADRRQAAVDKELADMLDQRPLLLEVGAAGWLLVAGETDAVLPLDGGRQLDAAKPIS